MLKGEYDEPRECLDAERNTRDTEEREKTLKSVLVVAVVPLNPERQFPVRLYLARLGRLELSDDATGAEAKRPRSARP